VSGIVTMYCPYPCVGSAERAPHLCPLDPERLTLTLAPGLKAAQIPASAHVRSTTVDPKTARVVQSYGSRSRWTRWLYHVLHSFDLPLLYRYRPVWDVVVLLLMLGGAWLCVTSLVIGGQRLRRKARQLQVRKQTA
jgi:hypothetical protein